MNNNELIVPAGFTADPSQERCPDCGWHGLAKIQTQKRCGKCGKQWGPLPQVDRGPTRREVLNGANWGTPRVIFWK